MWKMRCRMPSLQCKPTRRTTETQSSVCLLYAKSTHTHTGLQPNEWSLVPTNGEYMSLSCKAIRQSSRQKAIKFLFANTLHRFSSHNEGACPRTQLLATPSFYSQIACTIVGGLVGESSVQRFSVTHTQTKECEHTNIYTYTRLFTHLHATVLRLTHDNLA